MSKKRPPRREHQWSGGACPLRSARLEASKGSIRPRRRGCGDLISLGWDRVKQGGCQAPVTAPRSRHVRGAPGPHSQRAPSPPRALGAGGPIRWRRTRQRLFNLQEQDGQGSCLTNSPSSRMGASLDRTALDGFGDATHIEGQPRFRGGADPSVQDRHRWVVWRGKGRRAPLVHVRQTGGPQGHSSSRDPIGTLGCPVHRLEPLRKTWFAEVR